MGGLPLAGRRGITRQALMQRAGPHVGATRGRKLLAKTVVEVDAPVGGGAQIRGSRRARAPSACR